MLAAANLTDKTAESRCHLPRLHDALRSFALRERGRTLWKSPSRPGMLVAGDGLGLTVCALDTSLVRRDPTAGQV